MHRFTGKLASWNDERGFGFIEPSQGGQEVFVHIKAFPPGTGRPVAGLPLSFEVELGPQGKKRAKAVEFVRVMKVQAPRPDASARWTLPRMLAIPVFIAVYVAVARVWEVHPWLPAAYAALSLVTYIFYASDKSAAEHGGRRTPERRLHWLGLAGGWPGALLAQQHFRHKTSKGPFIATFWITVLLHIAGFVAWHAGWLTRI